LNYKYENQSVIAGLVPCTDDVNSTFHQECNLLLPWYSWKKKW